MSETNFNTSEVHTLKDMVEYVSGSTVSKIISRSDKGNLTLFAFDKGQNLSEHSAPFDAIVQVIDGSGTIIIDKKEHVVNEGQMIIMPANVPHAVEAKNKFKMLLTMIKA
ncbi:cupin domain-containing protein [Thermophagus sp. OGC60D27]|uniref:cupin domain-containing protein n=1 Tax=Thermophagus sp. OGC60D27 TaxID=3458415 RepID=UPI004038487B